MTLIGPVTIPDFGLSFCAPDVRLKIGEQVIGNGKLIISRDWLSWQPDEIPDGISFPWKSVIIHGITSFPSKCIYFMLNQEIVWPGIYKPSASNLSVWREVVNNDDVDKSDEENMDSFEEAEEKSTTECWLLPGDHNIVDTIYRAMSECQALNPDTTDDKSTFSDNDSEYVTLSRPYCTTPKRYGTPESDRLSDSMNELSLDNNSNCFADANECSD